MTVGAPDPRVGTDLGPYRIEAVIGRGGMGVVYRAEQARLGRKVALKIVSPEVASDPNARARFLRESQMAAAIDHPNILPIHEADEVHGVLFIAMRLVEGTDLAARLRDGALSPPAAIAILAQVASALDAAHARGLVHRDVKPANILLAPGLGADQGDHVYLTDFGLTKRGGADSSLTAVGGFAGTLDYIAPEQVDGRDLDGRADQYSLACMAFECLTGHLPFARDTDIAIAMAHLKDPPPSAASLKPELSSAIDEVLARGLAKAREDRYPTCMAFAGDLRDALGVTASQARPTQSPAPRKLLIGVGVAARHDHRRWPGHWLRASRSIRQPFELGAGRRCIDLLGHADDLVGHANDRVGDRGRSPDRLCLPEPGRAGAARAVASGLAERLRARQLRCRAGRPTERARSRRWGPRWRWVATRRPQARADRVPRLPPDRHLWGELDLHP